MSRRSFDEELRYLHEAGKEFAAAHPDQARYLNIDSLADRDPFVERLFEGFAFLSGRIRDQLDNEMVEYTEALYGLLWPQMVRPFPAASIIQFSPRPGFLQQTTILDLGTEVLSAPVGEENTVCRFSTTKKVHLHPIQLSEVRLESWTGSGGSKLSMQFDRVGGGVDFANLALNPLSLYLHAAQPIAATMHLFLTRRVERVVLWAGADSQNPAHRVELDGQEAIRAGGFDPEESLLPKSDASFSGYCLLHEYLNFRPKFNFIDLHGLDKLNVTAGGGQFHVEVYFGEAYPEDKRFTSEHLRLYCAPAINLVDVDTDPLFVDHQSSEYRVVPDVYRPRSLEVYSVEEVTGVEKGTGQRHPYVPFCGHQHTNGGAERFFTTATRPSPAGRAETYIALAGGKSDGAALKPETLSITARCTNGDLPREHLLEGSIIRPGSDFNNVATLQNLTRPTLQLDPPGRHDPRLFWRLSSHLSLNYASAASQETLVGQLRLYDWTGTEANRRRIDGIQQVSWQPKEVVYRGSILRGAEVILEIREDHFADEGDLLLFGQIMSEFFQRYATINSFVHLCLVSIPSGRRHIWRMDRGKKPLL